MNGTINIKPIISNLFFSFRSINFITSKSTLFHQLERKMSNAVNIEELKQRSVQADELIKKLKSQIEQIKLQTNESYKKERTQRLQKENEELKKKVEILKKELDAVEAKRGSGK